MAHKRYPMMAFSLGITGISVKQLIAQGSIPAIGLAAGMVFLSAWLVVTSVNHYWHHNL